MDPMFTATEESFLASSTDLAHLMSPMFNSVNRGGRPLRGAGISGRDRARDQRRPDSPVSSSVRETTQGVQRAERMSALAFQSELKSRRERLRADVLAALQISPVIR
jgi:hypothetical protein